MTTRSGSNSNNKRNHRYPRNSSLSLEEHTEKTTIFYGDKKATNALIQFVSRAEKKIDSVIDSNAPSVIVDISEIEKERLAARDRGVKFRYVTEINKDNISYCKEMLKFSEIRHLDGLKGNFEVSDNKEYVATATLQKAEPITQLIYINVKEVVEQQQYIFDSFWNRAIPSEQRIKEIEEGIQPDITEVIANYEQAEKIEWELLRSAKEEIQIVYSTVNAFHIQEHGGTIEYLYKLAEEKGVKVNIITPTDSSVRQHIEKLLRQGHKNNVQFHEIAPTLDIKLKTLVVDRKYVLIVELKHDIKETLTTALGFSFYSNSKEAAISYASIFQTLWNQSEVYTQLREADEIKTEFINIAAHELRTPIMPIIAGLEILEDNLLSSSILDKKTAPAHEIKQGLDIINRNALRLQKLSEDILQVSRIESGKFGINIDKQDTDINSLITDTINDIEKKYSYTGKLDRVTISFANHLHDKNERQLQYTNQSQQIQKVNHKKNPLHVQCDASAISEVLFNLLDNAMKFTDKGKITVSCRVAESSFLTNITAKNDVVIISIKDQGTGVDPSLKDRLFVKFATKSANGAGLGLYLSKKIVEAHGGKIWIQEEVSNNNHSANSNKGATFKFSIPIHQKSTS
jgi:two-component system sensor histidine kinase VicK